ncbi:S1 family peptidase [Actinomycetospora termitidis]|uniref:Serine protease n=1 Tax=Actinomycetospora termitidis TaxID=3053470 RepID=A0ABT7ME16_9PSEU|nr:serine protease [Actinomycetospora sp. Odt1-22]MDL5158910.1 serine protease [Actinomycetospora sp. Odt1-22]
MGEGRRGTGEAQRAVVRFGRSGYAVGAGMLLAPDIVATCAHVVAEALGHDDVPDGMPPDKMRIDLPFLPGRPERWAQVWRWAPPDEDGGGDVAVLRLDEPVPADPPPLRRVADPFGDAFQIAGFPPGREEGSWTAGEFRRGQASGWLQLVDHDDEPVGPGFSGAPVWDVEHEAVVAMAVAADLPGSDGGAYALPIDRVLALAPDLLVNPYRGLAALGEDDAEFFFGRDDDVARAVGVLDATRLLILTGGSGSGKSSLLAAGVIPALRRQGRTIAIARLAGADTAATVVEGIAAGLGAVGAEMATTWRARLRALLEGREVDDLAHRRLVVVIDQFEDLPVLTPEAARAALDVVTALARAGVAVALTARWATFDALRTGSTVADLQRSLVAITPLDRPGLRAAVAEPAARVPGPSFAPELVERIVDDAGDEPGRLPLVAATLTALWDDGRLTVEAYERVGRVEGALVTAAEQVWGALGTEERHEARDALTAMTLPVENGFVRHPSLLASASDRRRRVVERLAEARLVVIGPGPRGEVAELAHQALLEHWPRLRTWVEADADFLRWRAQVGPAAERWAADHEPGVLLRGADLETALRFSSRDDLAPRERSLVDASHGRRRRDRRVRTTAVAVVVVLALVAGVLSIVLGQSNGRLSRALAVANARTLAQLSSSRLPTDAGAATQLALAAYAADPDGVEAREAVGQAFLARRSTVGRFDVPDATGALGGLEIDPSSGAALVAMPSAATVVDGLGGPRPVVTPVPEVDGRLRPLTVVPGGRFVLLADPTGRTLVWDRTDAAPPRELPLARRGVLPTADGAHLLSTVAGGTEVRLDDLVTGASTAVMQLPEAGDTVWPTADPTRVLVRVPDPQVALADITTARPMATLTLRDVRTGAVLGTFSPNTVVAGNGRFLVTCGDEQIGPGTNVLTVADGATGTPTRRIPTSGTGPSCRPDSTMVTSDGEHLAWLENGSSTDATGTDRAQLVGLADGARSSVWLPSAAGLDADDVRSVEHTTAIGTRIRRTSLVGVHDGRVLLADGTGIDLLAPSTVPAWRDSGDTSAPTIAFGGPDGSFVVVMRRFENRARVVDRASGRVLGELDEARMGLDPGETVTNLGSFTDRRTMWVTTRSPTGPRVREFDLPTMTPTGPYELGPAGATGAGADTDTARVQLVRTPDRLVVLSRGVLSWWSTATHRLVAPPTPVATDPDTLSYLDDHGGFTAVDDAADTVAVRDPEGLREWRLGDPRPVPVDVDLTDAETPYQFDHGHLRTLEVPGTLGSRDPTDGHPDAPPTAIPSTASFVGNDVAGDIVTADAPGGSNAVLRFWDGVDLRPRGELRVPGDTGNRLDVIDGRWEMDTANDFVTIPVDADAWRAGLCAVQDRPFTDAERALLPAGADTAAPCGAG